MKLTIPGIEMRFAAAGLALLTIAILVGCAGPTSSVSDWEGARLSGRLADEEGHPLAGAFVYVYPVARSVMGPAEAMSEESASDGTYLLMAPPGEYVVVARKRFSGSIGGPLKNGDLHGRSAEPVTLSASSPTRHDLALSPFSQGSEGDPRKVLSTETRISGQVRDIQGRPVEGAHAFAYINDFTSRPPDYLSSPTDGDGRFSLSLPEGGRYVIGARTGLRGRPHSTDMLGFMLDQRRPVVVEDGSITEDVVVILETYGDGEDRQPVQPTGRIEIR